MDTKAALDDIDSVLKKPTSLTGGSAAGAAAAARYYTCIRRNCPPGHPYHQQADGYVNLGDGHAKQMGLLGVLDALRADIDAGQLPTFEERVRGEVYTDLLAMADGLRIDGHYRAAVVIAGAALEEHLRKLAIKNNVPVSGRSAADINIDLRKAGVYNEAMRASVAAEQALRNVAAHAKPGFEHGDTSLVVRVEPMIITIQRFIAQYQA